MRSNVIREFVELDLLMRKFSMHVELRLVNAFFSEYKKCLKNCHVGLPHNKLLNKKVKNLEFIEQKMDTSMPGEIKVLLQRETCEIISELDLVMKSLND